MRNNFVDVISINPGETYVSPWIDRLHEPDWLEKIKVAAYASVNGKITVDETDFFGEATPTINTLVNAASITANTMYLSAELTFTKRFYRISILNEGTATAPVTLRIIDKTT